MISYDYILFDLDGTLTDPVIGVTNAVMYALRHFGFSVTDRRELYPFIGPPLADSFQKYYHLSPSQAAEAIAKYREYYAPTGIFEAEVYPGIPEMLQRLRDAGLPLLLTTNKPEPYALQVLEHFDLARWFDYISGASMDESTQKWQVIRSALTRCGVTDPARAVMVGDRKHDAEGAKRCGVRDCIGVLYGYGSREELTAAGVSALAESPAQIADIILNSFTE